jgi:HK97 gp10 family phage protein
MATVRVVGTEEAIRNLERLKSRVQQDKALRPAYMAAAELVRAAAARRAPVGETGTLAGEMAAEWVTRKRYAIVGPSRDAFYGEFQERGTSEMAAQPFLRPAIDEVKDQAIEVIRREMSKTLEAAL